MAKKLMMNNLRGGFMEFIAGNNVFYRFADNVTSGNGTTHATVNYTTTPKRLGGFIPNIGGVVRIKYYVRTDTNYGNTEESGIVFEVRINGVVVEKKITKNSNGIQENIDLNINQGDIIEFYNYATPVGYNGNRFNGIELCCGNDTPLQFVNID